LGFQKRVINSFLQRSTILLEAVLCRKGADSTWKLKLSNFSVKFRKQIGASNDSTLLVLWNLIGSYHALT
jgi:hypothetical protein